MIKDQKVNQHAHVNETLFYIKMSHYDHKHTQHI